MPRNIKVTWTDGTSQTFSNIGREATLDGCLFLYGIYERNHPIASMPLHNVKKWEPEPSK